MSQSKSMLVLYEDNHLIAVYKPAGILVQGDITGDRCLMDEVKDYLKKKYRKPGQVFLGLLHRLDRPVSGIILFAKTSKGAARLSEQIRNHKIKKIYHAVVQGKLKNTKRTLINYLKKDTKNNVVSVFDKSQAGTLRAELNYEVVEARGKNTLVKINLITGRPHQIRAQFAHLGHPLIGDIKYGSKENYQKGQIALCATELNFIKATGEEEVKLKIEVTF